MGGIYAGIVITALCAVIVGAISSIVAWFSAAGFTAAAFLAGAAGGASVPGAVGLVILVLCALNSLRSSSRSGFPGELLWGCFGAVIAAIFAWWLQGGVTLVLNATPTFTKEHFPMETPALLLSSGVVAGIAALIAAITVIWFVENERTIAATVTTLISAAVLCWLTGFNPLEWIRAHPYLAAAVIPAYLAVGAFWGGYIRWGIHIGDIGRKVDEIKANFQLRLDREPRENAREMAEAEAKLEEMRRQNGVSGGSMHGWHRNEAEQLTNSINRLKTTKWWDTEAGRENEWRLALTHNSVVLPVLVSDNKSLILSWICYWPASMAGTLLRDPLRRAALAIYDTMKGNMQRRADRRLQGADNVWKMPPSAQ